MKDPLDVLSNTMPVALTGSEFCDLIVYTFQSIAIVRITFDAQFWGNVIDVVGPRYYQYILPKRQ